MDENKKLEEKLEKKMERMDKTVIEKIMEEQGLSREEAEKQLKEFII